MKNILLNILFIGCSLTLFAQRPYRSYHTQSVHQQLLLNHPELKAQIRTAEAAISRYRGVSFDTPKVIPIVFHVVHSNEQERISRAQIQSQIDALNRDFSLIVRGEEVEVMQQEGFEERFPEDTYIRFCLAESSQNGDFQESIIYTTSTTSDWLTDDAIKTVSPNIAPQHYLNVWIADLAAGISGYAQFPRGNVVTDGIVIDYRFFGTTGTAQFPYNEGKTLTHLIGNYLGLFDLWGEGGCKDDLIWDTPVHNAPNYGCPDYRHISLCNGGEQAEMYMNFMDNTDDACQFLFTYGQVKRMQTVLSLNQLRGQLGKGGSACSNFILTENTEQRGAEIFEVENPTVLQLYPNPASDELNLLIQSEQNLLAQLRILDATGKVILEQPIRTNSDHRVNCSDYGNGVFTVQIALEQTIISQRFVLLP
ncbi:MAG: M43 family zinc metalloprotease [Bacteroidota bacterium]